MPDRELTRTVLTDWTLHLRGPADAVPPAVRPALEGGLPVRVPATALAALVREGLVGDVTVDALEEDVAWVGQVAWEYRTAVPRPTGATGARLVLEGVDTVGRVLVDGEVRLEVADMHRRHVVDLPAGPVDGSGDAGGSGGAWDVRVQVDPVLPVARAAEEANPLPRADVYELPFNQVRKMACSFGWDWGPVTATSGLWRPVLLEAWPVSRLDGVRVAGGWRGGAHEDGAVLDVAVTVEGEAADVAVSVVPVGGGAPAGAPADPATSGPAASAVLPVVDGRAAAELPVPGAAPWQPVGLGEQPLHDVVLELRDAGGAVLDRAVRRLGFRDVRLRQEPDEAGRSFELVVNGERTWVRGFNWIPPHVLPEEVSREHLRHLVAEAVGAGANLLRVWGGGVVESDDFYDVCDELGVMVWQDFPFACAAYPEDEATVAQVRAEVADAVARIGHRTSLVLWCGCNENLWGYEDWGWKEALAGRPWGSLYYDEVLPAALAELDGTRPYVPGSPFSAEGAHPNDPRSGTTHHWDTWNELDLTAFEERTSRFAAEFGWQAPAGWPALVRAVGGAPSGGDDPRLARLQKADRGMEKLARGVAEHLPGAPADGRGWYLATQAVQAGAVRSSIGRFRSLHETCSGAVWWQLDDTWPALSWAVLDVTGRRKLAWYAMRQVLRPRAVLPTGPGPRDLTLVNDAPQPWEVDVVVTVASRDGAVRSRETSTVVVPARGHAVVAPAQAGAGTEAEGAVVVDAGGARGVRWLGPSAVSGTSPARVSLGVSGTGTGAAAGVVELEVRAFDLVRDLVVLAETDPRLPDAVVDDQLLTLLPGEAVRVAVRGARVAELTAEEWAGLLAAAGPVSVEPAPR